MHFFLTNTHKLCFEQKYEIYQNFSSENFHFWVVKFSIYLNRRVFVMEMKTIYPNKRESPHNIVLISSRKHNYVVALFKSTSVRRF